MGPKGRRIVELARAHADWPQHAIADCVGTSRSTVKVVLCRARGAGLIQQRQIDAERRMTKRGPKLDWLPEARREEYRRLCRQFPVAEARRMIEADIAKNGVDVSAHR